jgi:hypothetical protein
MSERQAPTERLTASRFFQFVREFVTVLDPRAKRPTPMVLYATQERFARAIFDRMDTDGTRLIRRALYGAPKKVGKSSFLGALILAHLLCEFDVDKEVSLFAWDKDQTAVIYRAIAGMVQRDRRLSDWITIQRDTMTFSDDLGTHTLTRIARDELGSHGGNPSLVVGDELWTQPDATMLTALSFSPVRLEPLMLFTSYGGYESDMVPGRPLYDFWLKLQPGAEPDPSFYGEWLTDVDALREVPWWTEKWIAEQARLLASEPGAFDRLIRNRWGQSSQSMFTADDVRSLFDPMLRPMVMAR